MSSQTQDILLSEFEGWYVGLIFGDGLYANTLPMESREDVLNSLGDSAKFEVIESRDSVGKLVIDLWLGKDIMDLPAKVTIDYSGYTPKERLVLEAVRKIGRGRYKTYGEVASEAGLPRAARFVGNVMRKNRCPLLIPCHRVVRSNGHVGGYSGATRGRRLKLRLLMQEGCSGIRL